MACKRVQVRAHAKCHCDGRFAKNSKCGLKAAGTKKRKGKKGRKRSRKAKK
jgi:hypothetical protein